MKIAVTRNKKKLAICCNCNNSFYRAPCLLNKVKYPTCSMKCRNQAIKKGIIQNNGKYQSGHSQTNTGRTWFKLGGLIGSNNNNWKGGITPINAQIRNSRKYKQWRSDVFSRDEWTCQTCGKRGVVLHAHHIYSFAKYPKLRLDINNGVTLCYECHKLTDNYAGKCK